MFCKEKTRKDLLQFIQYSVSHCHDGLKISSAKFLVEANSHPCLPECEYKGGLLFMQFQSSFPSGFVKANEVPLHNTLIYDQKFSERPRLLLCLLFLYAWQRNMEGGEKMRLWLNFLFMQPPLLIGQMANNPSTQRQLINSAMICSGIFTCVHVSHCPCFCLLLSPHPCFSRAKLK